MAAHERGRRIDVEKRKELQLSRYSHNLTNKILRKENGEVGRDIPDDILTNFQKGSIADRETFWREGAPGSVFAQQIEAWLGDENTGIAQWVEKQKDPDVLEILKAVGLRGDQDQKVTPHDFQDIRVTKVLAAMNLDYQKAGYEDLTFDDFSEFEARSLIFYSHFLSGEKAVQDTKSFIDMVVGVASSLSEGNIDETIGRLQKIAPLFQVAGMDMQEVLGALVVAKAHALDDHEKVVRVPKDAELKEDEGRVWAILQNKQPASPAVTPENTVSEAQQAKPEDESQSYTTEAATIVPLEAGKECNVQEVFTALKPEPTPGHKYWVEHVPTDFAEGLTEDQLKDLGIAKTFFVLEPDGKHFFPNEAVFPQARTLFNKDQRFDNAEALTQGDSGLFAEAAASAATPAEQMKLYQELGKTVLRVHEKNPHLLEEFLQAQSKDSIKQFGVFDFNKSARLLQQNAQEMMQQLQDNPSKNEDEIKDKMEPFVVRERDILGRISQSDERLVSLRIIDTKLNPGENILDEMVPAVVDIPQTVNEWLTSNRVLVLQQALQKDPLTLTPEQIRQIEFLAHSVDTAKAVAWMKGEQPEIAGEVAPVNPPSPEVSPSVPSPETIETVESAQPIEPVTESGAEAETTFEPQTIEEFFSDFDAMLKESPAALPRREAFALDANQLSEFPVGGLDEQDPYTKYEIVEPKEGSNDMELAIYDVIKSEQGTRVMHHGEFLQTLLQEDKFSYQVLGRLVNNYHFGPNIILPYVIEAAATPEDQQKLLTKLFREVYYLYDRNPSIGKSMHEYMTDINAKMPFEQYDAVERLFGDYNATKTRLSDLVYKLQNNEKLSREDFFDMGFYALPFDLKKITDRMHELYGELHGGSAPQENNPETQS